MEVASKTKVPPVWWTNVIKDLEKAAIAAKRSFKEPNTVLGERTDGEDSFYLIRLKNGKVGLYPKSDMKKTIPLGVKIKGHLPEASEIIDEPPIFHFAYQVIHSNAKLIPALWLIGVLRKILQGEAITAKDYLMPFPEWIHLPKETKEDKNLIDLLYRATRYEGIRGLTRYNDLAS